jgi:hypothetical protein
MAANGLFGLTRRFSATGRSLAFAWLAVAGLVVFHRNESYFKVPLYFLGAESNISAAEIDAGHWLARNAQAGDLLVSDPSTQYVLEAVSGVNSQGGAYMNLKTRQLLVGLNSTPDAAAVAGRVAAVQDGLTREEADRHGTLLVLSGRYFAWQKLPTDEKESFYYNVWQPMLLSPLNRQYIDSLVASGRFEPVFENAELAVLRVR